MDLRLASRSGLVRSSRRRRRSRALAAAAGVIAAGLRGPTRAAA